MRTKSSIYNFIVRLITSIVPSFLGLILNNLIIRKYGSDVNGVLGTINQLISLMTVFEGGFTLATTVALYKPYLNHEVEKINNILGTTKSIFTRVGIISFFITLILTFFAPIFIKSSLETETISILLMIFSINFMLQFFVTTKYTIMFSVGQKEYIIALISLFTNIFSQLVLIFLVMNGYGIVLVRTIALLVYIIQIPFIIILFKKHFPLFNFKSKTRDFSILESTKDIFTQKIATLVFGSTDMIIISFAISTKMASVYQLNYMIFAFIKSILYSLVLAPFHAFGQLNAEGEIDKLRKYYKIYQFISIIVINILITTTIILVLPFLKLYTNGINDVNYLNLYYVILFSVCTVFELISNILGSLSNSKGDFFEMKYIAIIMAIINITISIFLVKPYGITGVLFGTLIAYLVGLIIQLHLVHIKTLKGGLIFFMRLLFLNIPLSALIFKLSLNLDIVFNNYFNFFTTGILVFMLVFFLITIFNILTNFNLVKESYNIIRKKYVFNKN